MYVSVTDIKKHINVAFDDDDTLIESFISVAEQSIENTIGYPLAELRTDKGTLPAPVIHVIKLHVAKLYEYREGTVHGKVQEVPFTLAYLLTPYIRLS